MADLTYEQALATARGLVEQETLVEGFSNEYLRGVVNFLADCWGVAERDTPDRMDDILADLRLLSCRSCGWQLSHVTGDVLVEMRQHAPAGAPAHDAICNDDPAWRCTNVTCAYFAVEIDGIGTADGRHHSRPASAILTDLYEHTVGNEDDYPRGAGEALLAAITLVSDHGDVDIEVANDG